MRPEQWRWGSYAAVVAGVPPSWLDVDGLLARFRPVGGDPRERYVELVG